MADRCKHSRTLRTAGQQDKPKTKHSREVKTQTWTVKHAQSRSGRCCRAAPDDTDRQTDRHCLSRAVACQSVKSVTCQWVLTNNCFDISNTNMFRASSHGQTNIRQASAAGFSQPCTCRSGGAGGAAATYRRRRAGPGPAGVPAGQLTVAQLAQSEALLKHGDMRAAVAALGRTAVLLGKTTRSVSITRQRLQPRNISTKKEDDS